MRGRMLGHPAFHILIILIAGFAAYFNTFGVPFVFDDMGYILENPVVKKPDFFINPLGQNTAFLPENVRIHLYTRYLGYLSFYANYLVGGQNAFGYHVFNVTVHLLNGALVYMLAWTILGLPKLRESAVFKSRGWIALFSALVFTVHPIQTQAVTYISQRFACMAAVFVFSSVLAYAAFSFEENRIKRAVFYCLSLIAALAAFFTKENAIMLPLAIILFEISFVRGKILKAGLRISPFVIMAGAFALAITTRLQSAFGHGGGVSLFDGTYAITSIRVVATYLRLLFVPIGQSVEYDYPVFSSLWSFEILASVFLLVSIAASAVYCLYLSRKKDPAYSAIFFGVFWFFAFIAMENGLVKLDDVIFDHRMYLPSAGLIFGVSAGVFMLLVRTKAKAVIYTAAALMAASAIALGAAAHYRNSLWKTPVLLWEDSVRKYPNDARLRSNLGKTYFDAGRESDSLKEFQNAVTLDPSVGLAHENLAIMYERAGDLANAEEHYKTATVLMPNLAVSHFNLGKIYLGTGRLDEAEKSLLNAIKFDPFDEAAYYYLGYTYLSKGDLVNAREYYLGLLRLNPRNIGASEEIRRIDAQLSQGGK